VGGENLRRSAAGVFNSPTHLVRPVMRGSGMTYARFFGVLPELSFAWRTRTNWTFRAYSARYPRLSDGQRQGRCGCEHDDISSSSLNTFKHVKLADHIHPVNALGYLLRTVRGVPHWRTLHSMPQAPARDFSFDVHNKVDRFSAAQPPPPLRAARRETN
jgi:hypothetical protein